MAPYNRSVSLLVVSCRRQAAFTIQTIRPTQCGHGDTAGLAGSFKGSPLCYENIMVARLCAGLMSDSSRNRSPAESTSGSLGSTSRSRSRSHSLTSLDRCTQWATFKHLSAFPLRSKTLYMLAVGPSRSSPARWGWGVKSSALVAAGTSALDLHSGRWSEQPCSRYIADTTWDTTQRR